MNLSSIDWDKHAREHKQLLEELMQAKIDKDFVRRRDIEIRLAELDEITWQAKSAAFPALSGFPSLFHALPEVSSKLDIEFPAIPYSKENRFMFIISDDIRGILIIPRHNKDTYAVSLSDGAFEQKPKYIGETSSLEEVAIVLNNWYVQRFLIKLIQNKFPWR